MYKVTRLDTRASKTYATYAEATSVAKRFGAKRIRAIVQRIRPVADVGSAAARS